MPNNIPNSTNYEHPNEPNLVNLHKTVEYNALGQPVVRTSTGLPVTHTSYNALRTSEQYIGFYNSFQHSKELDVWDEQETAGGSIQYLTNEREIRMEVTNVGDKCIFQTRKVMNYYLGRSMRLVFAVNPDSNPPAVGVTSRDGIFDERNGVFLGLEGQDQFFVIRSDTSGSVVDRKIPLTDFNIDKLDGTGPTGSRVPGSRQLMFMEMEWYGAGTVRVGFLHEGKTVVVHEEPNVNRASSTAPYSGTPYLPIRHELENVSYTGGETKYVQFGSHAVIYDGTTEDGIVHYNQMSDIGTYVRTGTAKTFKPVIAIRLDSNHLNGVAILEDIQAAAIDNTNIVWRLILNPTITGGTWSNPNSYSLVETNITMTSYTGGTIIDSGFLFSGSSQMIPLREKNLQLGRQNLGTTSDVILLSVASLSGNNKDVLGNLNWLEQR